MLLILLLLDLVYFELSRITVSFTYTFDHFDINWSRLLSIDYGVDDTVYSNWSDAQLRAFLVKEKVLDTAAAANLKRNELENYVAANWNHSKDNLVRGWKESDMRSWLVQHGYLKSDAEIKKDEVSLI